MSRYMVVHCSLLYCYGMCIGKALYVEEEVAQVLPAMNWEVVEALTEMDWVAEVFSKKRLFPRRCEKRKPKGVLSDRLAFSLLVPIRSVWML